MNEQHPDRSKYWGNVFLSALLLLLDFYACIRHEIPWWTFGACAALCMGWMTPALFVDAFRMYARALHTPPPVAIVQAIGAAASVQGGDGNPPGGGGSGVTARTAAVAPVRIEPPPEQSVPRMTWPGPGLPGLVDQLERWGIKGGKFGAAALLACALCVAGMASPGCAGVPNASASRVTPAAVAGVLREVSASLTRAHVEARREVEAATPPPAGAAERLADLAASLRSAEALSIALDAYESAAGAARDSAGCRVRTIGGAVVTALVRVVAWLRSVGLDVPPAASLALQGGGLVLDLVAPSCPSASRGPAGGSYAWSVRELREHGVTVEPLPPAWRARFAPVLAGPAE